MTRQFARKLHAERGGDPVLHDRASAYVAERDWFASIGEVSPLPGIADDIRTLTARP
jgi:hypothetical protein